MATEPQRDYNFAMSEIFHEYCIVNKIRVAMRIVLSLDYKQRLSEKVDY